MSRGVEVAGFPFGPQPIWSRLHTVELASYRLRKDSMKFPPLAVIESFPHGLYKAFGFRTPDTRTRKQGTHEGYPVFVVEVAGFEPAAFWSRTKRATKLRYTSMLEPMRGLEPLTC